MSSDSSGVDVPDELRCPISCELFRDPVLAADGFKSLGAKLSKQKVEYFDNRRFGIDILNDQRPKSLEHNVNSQKPILILWEVHYSTIHMLIYFLAHVKVALMQFSSEGELIGLRAEWHAKCRCQCQRRRLDQ